MRPKNHSFIARPARWSTEPKLALGASLLAAMLGAVAATRVAFADTPMPSKESKQKSKPSTRRAPRGATAPQALIIAKPESQPGRHQRGDQDTVRVPVMPGWQ